MSDKRYRVSAKQRLELVKEAFEKFKEGIEPDVEAFASAIEVALTGKLEPKNKSSDDDLPF